MDVLEYAQEYAPTTMFVFVTGTIHDEEVAANTILNGASAYILKKHLSILHKKLLPLFEEVITKKKQPLDRKAMLKKMNMLVEDAKENNKIVLESY